MATRKRKRRRLPGEGTYFEFHGSFTDKTKAEARARARKGFFVRRHVPGQRKARYVVLVQKESPF